MEEQQDKDFYHYDYKSNNTHERMKYINNPSQQLMWKLFSKSILKKPRRSKDRKKSTIKRKLEKDL